jgi:hypothetical protein
MAITIPDRFLTPAMQTEAFRPEPITRAILEKFDVSNYETVVMHVEIALQVNTGLYTAAGRTLS